MVANEDPPKENAMKRLAALFLSALLLAALTVPASAAEPLTLETFREYHAALLPEDGAARSDAEKETLLSGLMEAGVTAIRDAIALGLVSSREVTAYYLERIEAYNKTYNCFITLCDDALGQARDLLPLHIFRGGALRCGGSLHRARA